MNPRGIHRLGVGGILVVLAGLSFGLNAAMVVVLSLGVMEIDAHIH